MEITDKLSVADAHILAALQMIALGVNPYSTHLVYIAADEIIERVAEKLGIVLSASPTIWVKPGHQKDWYAAKKRAANFLKHADRDHDQNYAGPDFEKLQGLNEMGLMICIQSLKELGHRIAPAFIAFSLAMSIFHPTIFKWDKILSESPELRDGHEEFVGKISRDQFLELLRRTLRQHGAL